MGGGQSSNGVDLDLERERFAGEHELVVNQEMQKQNVAKLSRLGGNMRMCWVNMTRGTTILRHYFVTDGTIVIEFGSRSDGTDGGPAQVLKQLPADYKADCRTEKTFERTKAVDERIRLVMGATNYSLLMRNSEHFARYIAGGSWTSMMTVDGSPIYELLRRDIQGMHKLKRQLLNQPPTELKSKRTELRKLFPNERGFIEAKDKQPKMLTEEDMNTGFNIVVLGPTGAGKSHLINQLFNMTVVKSAGGSTSVTHEMTLVQGLAEIQGEQRLVNVVDTIGFCDTSIEPKELHRLIKQYIQTHLVTIHKVVIVCAGRLESTHTSAIKEFLAELNYAGYPDCFGLVHTRCDGMEPEDRYTSLCDVCTELGVTPSYQRWWDNEGWRPPSSVMTNKAYKAMPQFSIPYTMAVSFPPTAPYSEVQEDLLGVLDMVCTEPRQPLTVNPSRWTCQIL